MLHRFPRLAAALDGPLALLVLVLLVAAWSVPIAARMIAAGDYPDHLRIAAEVAAVPHVPAPHFLYFVSVALLITLLPSISVPVAGIAVTTAFVLGTAAVVWWYLRRTSHRSPAAIVLVTCALFVAGPVLLSSISPDVFLIGFFVPNPYHNATIVAARPFAVALLIGGAAALDRTEIRMPAWVAAAAVLLSAVSKPNYLLCLVPALALVAAVRLIMRRPIRWPVLLAIVIPAATLVWVLREAYGARGVEVIVAPFAAIRFHTAVDATLALKLLASVAFPLAVIAFWPRLLITHGELALAWAAMIVALLQGYLLAEAGPRIDHANLIAGGSLAVFVLMVASCSAMLGRSAPEGTRERLRLAIAWSVFGLHIAGGFRHLLVTMMTPARWVTPLGYLAVAVAAAWLALLARQWITRGRASRGSTRLYTR
jgi:hypothetical protein